ncbi:hypothetical protein [Flavobacterium crocinum]|uniref:hypothetical protein n=1 Tax=Flavobacterium crocinum TaxID=2183896 RepID=UPI00142D9C2F|nr:hypothetical protein [Flavobacterium crocinum]
MKTFPKNDASKTESLQKHFCLFYPKSFKLPVNTQGRTPILSKFYKSNYEYL